MEIRNEMMLTKLKFADIHRDGGSYGASFETENGLFYNIWLQRSKMPMGMGCIIAGSLNTSEPIGHEVACLFSPEVRKRKHCSVD